MGWDEWYRATLRFSELRPIELKMRRGGGSSYGDCTTLLPPLTPLLLLLLLLLYEYLPLVTQGWQVASDEVKDLQGATLHCGDKERAHDL